MISNLLSKIYNQGKQILVLEIVVVIFLVLCVLLFANRKNLYIVPGIMQQTQILGFIKNEELSALADMAVRGLFTYTPETFTTQISNTLMLYFTPEQQTKLMPVLMKNYNSIVNGEVFSFFVPNGFQRKDNRVFVTGTQYVGSRYTIENGKELFVGKTKNLRVLLHIKWINNLPYIDSLSMKDNSYVFK